LRPQEIENKQFPWSFQRQLYDCLHDYVIEMFTLNPQRDDT
jgi:sigma54-dependent transcription regulator